MAPKSSGGPATAHPMLRTSTMVLQDGADAVPHDREAHRVRSTSITWRETFDRLRADKARIRAAMAGGEVRRTRFLVAHPSYLCVMLYRISHRLDRRGTRFLSRLFWVVNVVVTGSDLSPGSDLGGGLLIITPPGVAIAGTAGRNLTVMPLSGLGGEVGRREDVGAGPGLPLLGDDVVMGPRSAVLGPVRVGDRVVLNAGVLVMVDVPSDSIANGPRARFLRREDVP